MSTHSILLVEDTFGAPEFLRRLFLESHFTPQTVSSGLAALRRANDHPYKLVLVDVDLSSEPDGFETLEWFGRLFTMPAIGVSMRGDAETRLRASKAYPSAFLAWPFDGQELLVMVDHLVARHEAATSPPPAGLTNGWMATPYPGAAGPRQHDPASRPVFQGLPCGFAKLSGREWQIVGDLITTPSIQAVALKRQRSPHTVHNHVKSIFRKVNVHSVAELLSVVLRSAPRLTA